MRAAHGARTARRRPPGHLADDELPAVGDWVAARPLEGERRAVIEAVLPRGFPFTRKEVWRRTVAQVVAANVDTVFVVIAFGRDLNARRVERYLTATWDSGASPAIVVNERERLLPRTRAALGGAGGDRPRSASDRLSSYHKLRRELRALAIRKGARLRAEARKENRRVNGSLRNTSY